jgi:hypothetical protein
VQPKGFSDRAAGVVAHRDSPHVGRQGLCVHVLLLDPHVNDRYPWKELRPLAQKKVERAAAASDDHVRRMGCVFVPQKHCDGPREPLALETWIVEKLRIDLRRMGPGRHHLVEGAVGFDVRRQQPVVLVENEDALRLGRERRRNERKDRGDERACQRGGTLNTFPWQPARPAADRFQHGTRSRPAVASMSISFRSAKTVGGLQRSVVPPAEQDDARRTRTRGSARRPSAGGPART